jgi:uncharacterized protein (TIGR03437 family)
MTKRILLLLLSCGYALSLHAQAPVTVVSGASFQPGFPVAPGSYAQVWGNFAGFPTASADLSRLPLPASLSDVQVLIEGTAAPLYAVTPLVAAFLVPQNTAPGRRTIQVRRSGQVAGQGTFHVIGEAPGVFFSVIDGLHVGGVRNQRGDFAIAATPARRGEVIVIALTGAGTGLTKVVPDGQAATELIETTDKPEVFISVDKGEVIFSGLMPLFPGLWQINVTVPNKPYISGPVPLFVRHRGITSNAVVFWVQE